MFVPAQKFGTFSQFLVPSYQKLSVSGIEKVRSPGAHIVPPSDLRGRLRRAQVQFLDAVPKRQYVDAGSRETASAESVVQKTSGPSQEGPPECILPVPTSRDRVPLPYVAGTQDEKMFQVVRDRERWFQVVMGEQYKTDELSTDRLADRVPLPEKAAADLAFRLEADGSSVKDV